MALSDPSPANARQIEAWNGADGTHWAEHSSRRPDEGDLLGPLLEAARPGPGERVLDIGCGIGDSSLAAAELSAPGPVLGVDLSEAMIERARARALERNMPSAEFRVADAQTEPFTPGSFDLAISHFGTMFFADPAAAFSNIARSLAPGGRLVFVCPAAMEHCDWYRVPLAALLGEEPSEVTAPSDMFSLADPGHVRSLLKRAGFSEVSITPLGWALWFGPDLRTATEAFLGSGPVRAAMHRRGDIDDEGARTLLEESLAGFVAADGVRIPGEHWLVVARRGDGT